MNLKVEIEVEPEASLVLSLTYNEETSDQDWKQMLYDHLQSMLLDGILLSCRQSLINCLERVIMMESSFPAQTALRFTYLPLRLYPIRR